MFKNMETCFVCKILFGSSVEKIQVLLLGVIINVLPANPGWVETICNPTWAPPARRVVIGNDDTHYVAILRRPA